MKKNQPGLFHSTKTEQQFLYYQTDDISDEKSEAGKEDFSQNIETTIRGVLNRPIFFGSSRRFYGINAKFRGVGHQNR